MAHVSFQADTTFLVCCGVVEYEGLIVRTSFRLHVAQKLTKTILAVHAANADKKILSNVGKTIGYCYTLSAV